MKTATHRQWNSTLPQRKSGLKPGKGMKSGGKPLLRKTRLKPIGKKGQAWIDCRAELKVDFKAAGITTCEIRGPGCTPGNFLGFAHTRKRRNVTDLRRCALLCNHCHAGVEILPEAEMERRLEAIIAHRRRPVIAL